MVFRALVIGGDRVAEVCDALAGAGCIEAWTAPTCEAGVARARRERLAVDVVVVDVVDAAGATDAAGAAAALGPLRRLRDVPAIAIVDETGLEAALAARVADALVRPVRPIDLVARVRSALRLGDERVRRAARARALAAEVRRLQRENHELERLVCVDSLTGIANRRHVLSLLEAEWKRSARDGTPLALVMLDLDEFHAYNARYGHPGGDACLRRAAGAMVACLRRPSDFLGRYGGEEFVAILASTDAVGARIVAERLRATVAALRIPHEASSCAPVVTLSAGFAALRPSEHGSSADLVELADAALRRAKELGRNQIAGDAPEVPPLPPAPDARWSRCAAVTVDPWLADRIPPFLEAVRDDLAEIDLARRARHFERVRAVARRLRTAARELGFDEIRRLATEVERAARTCDREAIRRAAEELEQYAAHVQVVYRRQTREITAVAAPV